MLLVQVLSRGDLDVAFRAQHCLPADFSITLSYRHASVACTPDDPTSAAGTVDPAGATAGDVAIDGSEEEDWQGDVGDAFPRPRAISKSGSWLESALTLGLPGDAPEAAVRANADAAADGGGGFFGSVVPIHGLGRAAMGSMSNLGSGLGSSVGSLGSSVGDLASSGFGPLGGGLGGLGSLRLSFREPTDVELKASRGKGTAI